MAVAFQVDIQTLLIILSVGNLISLLLLSAYHNDNIVKRSHCLFIASKVFEGIAWMLLALRGRIPDEISVYVGNSLLIPGYSLEVLAIVDIDGPKRVAEIIQGAFSALFIAAFFLLAHKTNEYAFWSSIFAAAIFLAGAGQVWRVKAVSKVRILIGAAFILESSILVFRSLHALRDVRFALMTSAEVQSLTFLGAYAVMILSGTGYLLLNKERTDRQLSATMMELEAQARVDALTGLANRRTMNHYLRFSLSENRRRAEPVAVLMIDIDHFKRFNDVYGHIAGDKCLQAVAEEIRRHCRRSTDLAARFGGEEFLFIMWDIENDEALRVADGIREGVRALGIEHAYSDADSVVTISIGVFSAIPDDEGATEEWYIEQADKRLYEAKKSGRNRCCAASRQ